MKEVFNLEWQYQEYLKRVNLPESKMHPIQRIETKRAFMAAAGQMLITLRDEVSKLDDDEAVKVMENMTNQVADYWLKTRGQKN